MRPVTQTLFRPSEGDGAGNCLQAALASVLELPLEAVPHVAVLPKAHWRHELDVWLEGFGLALLPLTNSLGLPWVPPGAWMLVVGKSPRGDFNHVVVARAGAGLYEFAHDPHPSDDFLDGQPIEVWVFVALDPANARGSNRGDLGGDVPCSTCGTTTNPVWFTDNVFWNDVVRTDLSPWGGAEPILCVLCFVALAETKYRPAGWRLAPEFRWERAAT